MSAPHDGRKLRVPAKSAGRRIEMYGVFHWSAVTLVMLWVAVSIIGGLR